MKCFLSFLTFIAITVTVNAQTTEDSIKTTINKLFDGMKNSDAALLKSAFADSAILQTITNDKSGTVKVKNEMIDVFADFIGKQQKGAADERIVFDVIKIDGPLAIAWTTYNFYFNGIFSHCGVNSFQLVKLNGNWKIQYLIDTRRKNGCN